MPARRDRIAGLLEGWRAEHPGEPFIPQLDRVSGDLADVLRSKPLREVRSLLAECGAKKAALEKEYPHLKRVHLPYSDRREDWEYNLCEALIPLLRLEIDRRTRGGSELNNVTPPGTSSNAARQVQAESTSARETLDAHARSRTIKEGPDVAKRRAIVRSNPGVLAIDMCTIFDRNDVPLPTKWQIAGLKSWSEAYKKVTYRARIDVLLSKDRRHP